MLNSNVLASLAALKNGAALTAESTLPPLLGAGTHTVSFKSVSFRSNSSSQSSNPVCRAIFGNDTGDQIYSLLFMPEANGDNLVCPINLRIFLNQALDLRDSEAAAEYASFFTNEVAPVIAQNLEPSATVTAIGEAAAKWLEGLLYGMSFVIDVEPSNDGRPLISYIEPVL